MREKAFLTNLNANLARESRLARSMLYKKEGSIPEKKGDPSNNDGAGWPPEYFLKLTKEVIYDSHQWVF